MGIKNLNSVLKKYSNFPTLNMKQLKDKIIGVDFSLFLYRFLYNQNNPVECFLRQLILFFRYNILPVYVLDGNAPDEKKMILDKRAIKRIKNYDEIEKLKKDLESNPDNLINIEESIQRLEKKKSVCFSRDIIDGVLTLFHLCGVPVIQENYESDWVLAKLSQIGLIDYVLSEDSDLLAFGARKVMKNFSIIEETTQIYDLKKILKSLQITYPEFIDMCILCGCDYAPKMKNSNCLKSYELIQKHKKIENIQEEFNMDTINSARNIFLKQMDKELIDKIKEKICKKEFKYNDIELYLQQEIDKKFLIPIFIRTCKH